jgi:asparagine synthase (glutamine-hydrolysing)
MSAIGGLLSRNGAPLDGRALRRLGKDLAEIGPDGQSVLLRPPVGMVFCAFHTDRESRRTQQPVAFPDGCLLAWNGRLDNRSDLVRDLGESLPATPREVDFVLAAFRRWGIDGLSRLIGDFSLALWDPADRLLLLACDVFSVRPLYYVETRDVLLWASRARPLLAAAGLSPEVDEEFVASFLTCSRPSGHSPFRAVRMLPPGSALVVREGDAELRRIWSPDPGREIRYRSDRDYEDHFRTVFREAVACRLRADGPVYADLSGGLDSSSIVCVADEVLAAGQCEAPELRTVSWVYDQSRTSDERHFIRFVEEKRGAQGLYLREEEHPMLSPVPASYCPDYPHGHLAYLKKNDGLVADMARAGARVLLRGTAGDHVLWGGVDQAPLEIADLLARGRLGQALRASFAWSPAARSPWHSVLWQGGILPLLPRSVRARLQTAYPLESWFESSFIERLKLAERVGGVEDDAGFARPSTQRRYSLVREVSRDLGWEFFTTSGCAEMRFPFMDRRLIEFALAIDVNQWQRPGETKSLLRRALAGILPEEVRVRRSKAGPDEALYRACVRESGRLSEWIADARVCAYGFVNRKALIETFQRVRHGVPVTTPQLLRTLCLEFWLRSLEGRHKSERMMDPPTATTPWQSLSKGEGNDSESFARRSV